MRPVLLITGSTGIAAETALRASKEFAVFIVGLDEGSCAELNGRVPGAAYLAGDLREERVSDHAVRRCVEHHGRVDALFNVAGISGRRYGDGPLHECSAEGWDRTMESNVRTMFLMSRAVLRHWMETGGSGAILNMASVLAASPEPKHFATHAYAASKGAVVALTRSMASYYSRNGIRVNAIAPGLVATPMSARAQTDAAVLEFIATKQPLAGGILEPGDIAEAALFLLGARSRHVTGLVLTVDGGWSVA
jgi:NAD(P)-dependent dehydrogenase (short-subunit alcohol dehydrogenase family)